MIFFLNSKIGKGFKNWILKMSHTPQKENFVLTNFMTGDEGIHKLRYNLLKYPILEIHIHPWNQFLLGRLFIRRSSNLDKLKSSEKRQFQQKLRSQQAFVAPLLCTSSGQNIGAYVKCTIYMANFKSNH